LKTTQIIERPFYDGVIQQDHKTGFLNTKNMIDLGNQYRKSMSLAPVRLDSYLKSNKTKEFIEQILEQEKITTVMNSKRGKYGGTWMHPLLFVDFAMYVSPKFKYLAMSWLSDHLLSFRDASGDSYKAMGSELEKNYHLGARIGVVIPEIARKIKTALNVEQWNTATEQQLKARDIIHKQIIFGSKMTVPLKVLVDLSIESAVVELK
jgi:hypothetical protein